MSDLGQTRSFGDVGSMSGLPESGHGYDVPPQTKGREHTLAQGCSLAPFRREKLFRAPVGSSRQEAPGRRCFRQ